MRDMDEFGTVLSSEHGKTIPDAEGRYYKRDSEVAEFCVELLIY